MKWIKSREKFLSEAKIGEVIFPRQSKEIKSVWGEKYLEYEEIEPTDKIEQGTWKLEESDKLSVLSAFFETNMERVLKIFELLPERFTTLIQKSIDLEFLKVPERVKSTLEKLNLKNPSIDEINVLYSNVFKKLSISETLSDEVISRDDSGRPIMDEQGRPLKIKKEIGEPIFSKNLINIIAFFEDYNRCYPEEKLDGEVIDEFRYGRISSIKNLSSEDFSSGKYEMDFDLFKKDIFLLIRHNPKDILNISVSKFFTSCQHLYEGGYREQLLGNLFDPNTVPAFLMFDTPIYWNGEKISEFVPLSRMFIRNIESFDSDEIVTYFDRSYPDRMKSVFDSLIEKYTKNKKAPEGTVKKYLYTPDISPGDNLKNPYHDRLSSTTRKMIGINTKKLHLTSNFDWSDTIISPKAKIEELTIETTDIPQNLFKLNLNLNWIKFKFLNLINLSDLKLKSEGISFDKCKLSNFIVTDFLQKVKIKKLQFISCDLGDVDLKILKDLEELQLIFSVDKPLEELISGINIKKLVLSTDLLSSDVNKKFIKSLKSIGVKIETIGPKI